MTDARSTFRRRRKTGSESVPHVLAEWFRGERVSTPSKSATPWMAMAYPDGDLLSMRWQAWKAENPKSTPPAGWEWLDDPASKRHPSPARVARALACKGR